MGKEKPRFLILGIDGADHAIVERLMREGLLPRLKGIAERGAWGGVRSTIPPMTPPAWTTIMTGKNPGRHGVFDFLPLSVNDAPTSIASRRRCMTVWKALSDRGWRVGTYNLPGTYPPEELSGFQVSGFDTPSFGPEMARPRELFDALRDAVGEYDLFPESIISQPEGSDEAAAERARLPVLGARALLTARPCDVFMVSFQLVDWMQHGHLGREMTPEDVESLPLDGKVSRAYGMVDENLGALLDEWCDDDTTVMVISDHGGAVADRLVNLEKLFLDWGLMSYAAAEGSDSRALEAKRSRARTALRCWEAVKRRAPWAARLLRGAARAARGKVASYQEGQRLDWSRTRAAAWGLGQIKLNREAIGDEAAWEALASEISEGLLALRDPATGEAVYSEVARGADAYIGPYADEGADLIAVPRGSRYFSASARAGTKVLPLLDVQQEVVVGLSPPSAGHSPVGIMFVRGPGVQPGSRLGGAGLADLVPTLLYLMDEALPEDLEGRVLEEAIAPQVIASRPVAHCPPWPAPSPKGAGEEGSEADQAALETRLRALGYL